MNLNLIKWLIFAIVIFFADKSIGGFNRMVERAIDAGQVMVIEK